MTSVAAKQRSTKFLSAEISEKVAVAVKGKNVLVTGGTGSFGNSFIDALLRMYEPIDFFRYNCFPIQKLNFDVHLALP